jgi:DNA invertase Pin-like site-specific DNA recombinase
MTASIRCTIYTRKSTEEGLQQDFNSLDAQRESCAAFISSQRSGGWIALDEIYDDGGYSGGTLERPALQRLIRHVEEGRIDVVVVYKIDRLSRSLLDFAKLVELFDRRNVTFVSVTQSFNTTTSMGRLTLNMLLSFAQFEREIISERVRDKVAASKKKGMWMGGPPPLGYDIRNRRLVVNEAEAETVRHIYQRYRVLGCVRALQEDLANQGICSKRWISRSVKTHGGNPFDRGALYCLLKNRLYLGETVHKGTSYKGEHTAILDNDLFTAVQRSLAQNRRREPGTRSAPQHALLAGLLFDDIAQALAPTYSCKADGRRYRYYVSSHSNTAPSARLTRVPAPPIEDLIQTTLSRLRLPCALGSSEAGPRATDARAVLRRVNIRAHSIVIRLDRSAALSWWRTSIAGGEAFEDGELINRHHDYLDADSQFEDEGDFLVLTLRSRAKFRGGRPAILASPKAPHRDPALISALARAYRWKQMVLDGEATSIDGLARTLGKERRHVGCTLALAFLSPEITRAILNGDQPRGLRLTDLLETHIPIDWQAQKTLIARLAAQRE